MAKQTVITLVDDVDGTEAAEEITFALDGVSYEIDLSEANAEKLREALAPWVGAARRTGGRAKNRPAAAAAATSGRRHRSTTASVGDTDAIRQWARDNGHQVKDRGRISPRIQEAYAAAHA